MILNRAEVELTYLLRDRIVDPIRFAEKSRITMRPEQEEILRKLAESERMGLASAETIERAVVLGTLWRVLRKPGAFALIYCQNNDHGIAWMQFAHHLCHEVMAPEIGRHIEFPTTSNGTRMRVAGRASWGIAFAWKPQQLRGHEHQNLTVVELEAGRAHPDAGIVIAGLLEKAKDRLHISIW